MILQAQDCVHYINNSINNETFIKVTVEYTKTDKDTMQEYKITALDTGNYVLQVIAQLENNCILYMYIEQTLQHVEAMCGIESTKTFALFILKAVDTHNQTLFPEITNGVQ